MMVRIFNFDQGVAITSTCCLLLLLLPEGHIMI